MSSIDLFGIFLLLATIAVIINRKLPKLPDTIGVILFSLISCLLMLGVSQFWHHDILSVPKKLLVSMDMPDIFLHVALPLLLFAGTMGVNLKHLLNRVVSITSLSIIGTVISIFVFGTILFYVFPVFNVHIGYSWCIAIGAILAPTDPVSVVSVLKKLGLPAPVQAVFAGESLFNDGIAVSIFSMAMGTALSTSIIPIKVGSELNDAFNLFLREGIGGIIVGFCTGYIAIRVLRKIPDIHVSLLVTLTLAICTYSLADAIDTSGAIAVVVSGLWYETTSINTPIPY